MKLKYKKLAIKKVFRLTTKENTVYIKLKTCVPSEHLVGRLFTNVVKSKNITNKDINLS
jgi:hypothetical protein